MAGISPEDHAFRQPELEKIGHLAPYFSPATGSLSSPYVELRLNSIVASTALACINRIIIQHKILSCYNLNNHYD
jgi:hypothetical protein